MLALGAEGLDVKAQVAPRPIGILLGLEVTGNVFSPCLDYARIAKLPLPERVAALREPERRERILAAHASLTSGPDALAGALPCSIALTRCSCWATPSATTSTPAMSLGAQAARGGFDPRAYAYDVQLNDDGRQLIYVPLFNFVHNNLEAVREMITSPGAMFGLSDAGAHCGQICDASTPTSYLSIWARDRLERDGIALEAVVHQLTRRPARHLGWLDRGVVAPGYLADLNVIELESLGCLAPSIATDLPAGGRRLVQAATGYRWTVKRGAVISEDGLATGERPGRLLRGARPSPARADVALRGEPS